MSDASLNANEPKDLTQGERLSCSDLGGTGGTPPVLRVVTRSHWLGTTSATRSKRFRGKFVVLLLVVVGGGVGWTLIAQASSVRVYQTPSSSMSPAIQAGDKVAVRLGQVDRTNAPKRGELWIFAMPATGQGLPNQIIKRVIGLPGETIAVENGKVVIDGKPLDEPYLGAPMTYAMEPRKLSNTEYFLMGDKRNASMDSTVFGPVPVGRLIGRVLYRLWPLDRAGNL